MWIDLSATAGLLAGGPFVEQFAWVCRKVGVDRLLFGSDYPMDMPKAAAAAVGSYGFTPAELSAILYDNAAALFDFRRASAYPDGPAPRRATGVSCSLAGVGSFDGGSGEGHEDGEMITITRAMIPIPTMT